MTSNQTTPAAPTAWYEIVATLLEDLHTGSGLGTKELDSTFITDRNGSPTIRSSHFKGLLREQAVEMKQLGLLAPERVNELFGAPGQGGRKPFIVTSFALKKGGNMLTWTSTARKPFTRLPLNDTLRSFEYVSSSSVFCAQVEFLDPAAISDFRKILGRTNVLGGGRNRGGGLVRMKFNPVQPPENCPKLIPPVQGTHHRLKLVLRNLDPICLPVTGFPGNLIAGECYIRGQQLAGALTAWALQRKIRTPYLFGRKISVGNALPSADRLCLQKQIPRVTGGT